MVSNYICSGFGEILFYHMFLCMLYDMIRLEVAGGRSGQATVWGGAGVYGTGVLTSLHILQRVQHTVAAKLPIAATP